MKSYLFISNHLIPLCQKYLQIKLFNEISMQISNTMYLKEELAQKSIEFAIRSEQLSPSLIQVYTSQSLVSLGFLAQLQLMCISLIF